MVNLEMTKEEAQILSDYLFKRLMRLEEAGLKDSTCYKVFYKLRQKLLKEIVNA